MMRTWEKAIDGWVESLRAAGAPHTTIQTRTDHLRRTARSVDVGPWSLTGDELVTWTSSRDWAPETRRSVRASLRSFYRWAIDTGRTTENPALALPKVKATFPNPRPAPDECYEAAHAAARPRERLMLRLSAEVGLRRAEVAVAHSRDLMQDLSGWSLVVHGKGGKTRLVPLPASLGRDLRRLPEGYFFPGNHDGHLSPRWVGKLIAGLLPGDLTMHTLRHRFATRAYSVDRDVFTVQELLGHASPATTRAYVRIPDHNARRLVDAINP